MPTPYYPCISYIYLHLVDSYGKSIGKYILSTPWIRLGHWFFKNCHSVTHHFQGGDSRFPPLKGLGDSLHDLLRTELRQQRDGGGANRGWWGGEPWEDPMTPGDVKLLWCRGLGLPVKPPQVVSGEWLKVKKSRVKKKKPSDIYSVTLRNYV